MSNPVDYLLTTAAAELKTGHSPLAHIAHRGGARGNSFTPTLEPSNNAISPTDHSQNTRLAALERSYNGNPNVFARNRGLDATRTAKRHHQILTDNAAALQSRDHRPRIREPYPPRIAAIVADLPDRQRTVAFYLASGYSQSDIARILGISRQNTSVLVSKIRATLLRAIPGVGRGRGRG